MPRTIWTVQHDGFEIRFVNEWNFRFETRELLMVDGRTISERRPSIDAPMKSLVRGTHEASVTRNGREYRILVQCGSKWPGLFLGCHIWVDGDLVGGDTRSRLMLAEKVSA